MIKVEVRLFASLREGRDKKHFLDLDRGSKIEDVFNKLKIKKEEVNLILLNGIDGDLDRELKDRDVLSLFPPVGGG